MRTVYEILKEVGLDHKDAVMIDFAYSHVEDGYCGLINRCGKAITNDAADLLNGKVGISGAIGCRFYSYEEVRKELDEKFPEGEPITFSLPFTKTQVDKIVKVLGAHEAYNRNGCLLDFQNAWANRKVV